MKVSLFSLFTLLTTRRILAFNIHKGNDHRSLCKKSKDFELKAAFSLEETVNGDKVFKIHSIAASGFGSLLLFYPNAVSFGDPASAFALQMWSIFILAVSVITFNASNLEEKSKKLLAQVYFWMCLSEAILTLTDIVRTIQLNLPKYALVDIGSLGAFAFIAYLYWLSGATGYNEMLNKFRNNTVDKATAPFKPIVSAIQTTKAGIDSTISKIENNVETATKPIRDIQNSIEKKKEEVDLQITKLQDSITKPFEKLLK